MARLRRNGAYLLLTAAATAVVLESVVSVAQGSHAPGWLHWWCSPAALRSAAHTAGGGGGLAATLLTLLEVHWPHFLPILLGLATLVYLWRADARYHSRHADRVPLNETQ